jgi:hypothetical protein
MLLLIGVAGAALAVGPCHRNARAKVTPQGRYFSHDLDTYEVTRPAVFANELASHPQPQPAGSIFFHRHDRAVSRFA